MIRSTVGKLKWVGRATVFDRTSRHPIRSTILGAIAAALATIALLLVASGNSAQAASSLVNGNFETGDLTGWSVDTTNGGNASVVDSYFYYHNPLCEAYCSHNTILPQEGSYFALLTSGNQQSEVTRISQPFEASNGDKVSGWAFFRSSVETLDDDKAQVVIKSTSGTTVATPFEQSVSSVGTGGDGSGWRYWEYAFTGLTGTAQFRIEARLHKPGPSICPGCSVMGLDDVKTSIAGPDITPPETYITSGPNGTTTSSTSATFEFHSNEQGSTFRCQLSKDGAVVQAWADCTSPKSYSNLSRAEQWETQYRFEVKATDPAGNVDPTPASRSWFIERAPADTTAPSVMSTVPAADASGVDRTTNVTATFSERMDPFSITTSTFKLFKKGSTTKIAATVSYPDPNSPPYTAKLDPSNSLRRGVTYKAVVTTGAKDLAANPLAQQYTWFFTVG